MFVVIFFINTSANVFAKTTSEECKAVNKFDKNIPGYAGFISFNGIKPFRVIQDQDAVETQVADCIKDKDLYYALTVTKFDQSSEEKGNFIGVVKYNDKGLIKDRYYLNPDYFLCELNSKLIKTNNGLKIVMTCNNKSKTKIINKMVK